MEHCRHGDLRQYLLDKHSIPADEVQQLIYQLLEGLDQMHKNDFAHRDVKPGVCISPLIYDHLLILSEHSYQSDAARRGMVDSTRRLWD